MSTLLMLPSQVLEGAADVIVRNGWTQDAYIQDIAGRAPERCPVCPDGAIAIAAGRHPEFGVEPFEHPGVPLVVDVDDPHQWTLDCPDAEAMEVVQAARAVFARHLRTVLGVDVQVWDEVLIARWNDEPSRTSGEVLRELYAAAAAAREAGR